MAHVCVIGGTRFFGRVLVGELLAGGNTVTVLTRGRARDDLGDTVRRLTADAEDATALRAALGDREFDAVVHQVCYRPTAALAAVDAFTGRTGKLVMTSSMEVYNTDTFRHHRKAPPISTWALESELDPAGYGHDLGLPWDEPGFLDRNYGEGKRQAESALAEHAGFPVAFARAAHVLAAGEFTGRVGFLAEHVLGGRRMASFRDAGRTSLVHAGDLARFLAHLALDDVTGPVNACSPDPVNLREICAPFAEAAGRPAVVDEVDDAANDPDLAPFTCPADYGMSPNLAERTGYGFAPTRDWLPAVAAQAVAAAKA